MASSVLSGLGFNAQTNEKPASNSSTIGMKDNCDRVVVGVYGHDRDAKVAIEALKYAGLPMNWIVLVARHCQRYEWMPGLTICDRPDGQLSQASCQFFHKYYRQGKYLVIVKGTDDAICHAAGILSRRRKYSQVWDLRSCINTNSSSN